ncbi:hypothetical protein GGQ97_000384 [Sphingomonas kaistensis]|uniref:Uncharacterized protein n=1 Tax=Sphingomonas kaistensis TaxID=298708 RepID=A0A7X5Y3P5_9SPHN|nr:hypothetical protein [Sphingomonas kaistensis]
MLDSQVKDGIAEALAGLPYDWTLIPDEEGRNYLLTSSAV